MITKKTEIQHQNIFKSLQYGNIFVFYKEINDMTKH